MYYFYNKVFINYDEFCLNFMGSLVGNLWPDFSEPDAGKVESWVKMHKNGVEIYETVWYGI